ncbi:CDP-alcohol phosphatidyltransferase family protein [Streptomyces sp. A3M-1-3]|nr:CDP-alcohol phosphatidyltransferase family protein [Streptomyces sp. A3M-1-3]MCP3819741.1 CDP-alcohol phosphatidyltransferase family protein [Streptomyces sp. A3M-1-3]
MSEFSVVLRLLSTAQKSAKGVSVYTLFVNRPAGRLLAALAYRIGATPNQVTAVGALFTFPALLAVALVRPGTAMACCVSLALAMGFALDSADGQLARSRRSGSISGEWLDHVLDCARTASLHLVVLISFYRFFDLPDPLFLLAPMAFQLAAVVVFFAGILTEQLKRKTDEAAAPATRPSALRSLLLLPVDYGVLCVVFLFLGSQDLFLGLYCALLVSHVLFMAAFLVKWFRELS